MGMTTGSIIKNIENSTMQNSMRESNVVLDYKVDSLFAKSIYMFLTNQSNLMPKFEIIDSLIEKSENNVISIGYGIDVDADLTISIEEPIANGYVRIDVISKDDYYAYKHLGWEEYKMNNIGGKNTEIDVNEQPRFDIKRIQLLQKYLNEYNLYLENKTSYTK